jgi:hypothetical protein
MRSGRTAFALAALMVACGGKVQVGSSEAAGEDGGRVGGKSGSPAPYADAANPDAARDAGPDADGTQHTDAEVSSPDAETDNDAALSDSPAPSCTSGREACGLPHLKPCPNGQFCMQGCCTPGGPA